LRGALAEFCAQYVTKGSHVYVAGRLHTLRWNDAETGERHARVEIVLDDLILLDRPTPTATPEDAQDAGVPQPSAPAPRPRQAPSNRSAGHPSRSNSGTHRLNHRNAAVTTADTIAPGLVLGRPQAGRGGPAAPAPARPLSAVA
jgi:single-stranded DNA-binding protein